MAKICLLIFVISIIRVSVSHYIEQSSTSVCSNEVPDIFKREYSVFANSVSTIFESFELLTNTESTISCQINLRLIVDNFTKIMDESLKSVKNKMQSNINDIDIFISKNVNIVTVIREGDYCAARVLFQQSTLSMQDLVSSVYERNLLYGQNILEFLNSLHNVEETILGCRILLEQMIKNGHLYSTVTTAIAYQVMNVFHLNNTESENYIYLRNNLPQSLKNFPWTEKIFIKNIIGNEQFFGANEERFQVDSSRRNTFTYLTANCVEENCQSKLIPTLNGSYFYIKIVKFNELFYADTNDFALSNQRRRVFSWKLTNEAPVYARWQFEPIEGSEFFKIKNVYWNEYLFIDGEFLEPSQKLYRNMFTWRHGGCEQEGCKWRITRA